ncbi:MAG: GtrA family protein [Patescibacteria group bacterium]
MPLNSKQLPTTILKEFGKFAVVGVIGTAVDFSIYSVLTRGFDVFYIYATCISVFIAIVNNFIWNKYWTFEKGQSGKTTKESYRFFLVSIVNYFLNIGITYAVVTYTHAEVLFHSSEDYFAKAIAIGIVLFSNYFGNKYWTFKS